MGGYFIIWAEATIAQWGPVGIYRTPLTSTDLYTNRALKAPPLWNSQAALVFTGRRGRLSLHNFCTQAIRAQQPAR
eukprot:1322727-Amphidinium_carterae.1